MGATMQQQRTQQMCLRNERNYSSNECSIRMHELCLGTRRVGDSNRKWRQGMVDVTNNKLESGKRAK
jgi:hypothetical protein